MKGRRNFSIGIWNGDGCWEISVLAQLELFETLRSPFGHRSNGGDLSHELRFQTGPSNGLCASRFVAFELRINDKQWEIGIEFNCERLCADIDLVVATVSIPANILQ